MEGAHKEQVDSDRTGTHHAEDAQEEQKELKKKLFPVEKRSFAKSAKTPQLASSSKVGEQPASPKTPQLASSSKVGEQPASPKIPRIASSSKVGEQPASPNLLDIQLLTPKVEIVTAQSNKSNRPGRPKGIVETRPRPSLKRHERIGQDQTQEQVQPGFLVAYSHKLRCLHFVGRCWRRPGRDIKKMDFLRRSATE